LLICYTKTLTNVENQFNQKPNMKLPLLLSLVLPTGAFIVPFSRKHHASSPQSSFTETIETQNDVTIGTTDVEQIVNKKTDPTKLSTPAEYENIKFQCDETVNFWMDFNRQGLYETQDYIKDMTDVSDRFFAKGGEALRYWIRHNARTGYFVTNAALGTISSQLYERLRSKDAPEPGGSFANRMTGAVPRILTESVLAYEQDYDRIENGKYKLPYDMYTRNRQNSPFFMAQQTSRFISEAVGVLTRRNRGSEEDKRIWLSDSKSNIYPDYYKTAFHYQTNGWMSQDSANVYETSTETLFLGRQDAMQRTALVPLVQYVRDVCSSGEKRKPMKVLEVACGTGRFMTFARDNLPLDTEFTAVDLSPFYLNNAKDNDKNWRSIREQVEASSGNTQVTIKPANFVQAKGEDLPFHDEEFDAVICMYLYHEIPREIRSQVSSEMARVTQKGGKIILTDSCQKGDRPANDAVIGNFAKMNEPHWNDFVEDCLPAHFENVGMECSTKIICSSTKTLAFNKPREE